jgi:hypothetical protein
MIVELLFVSAVFNHFQETVFPFELLNSINVTLENALKCWSVTQLLNYIEHVDIRRRSGNIIEVQGCWKKRRTEPSRELWQEYTYIHTWTCDHYCSSCIPHTPPSRPSWTRPPNDRTGISASASCDAHRRLKWRGIIHWCIRRELRSPVTVTCILGL